MAWQLEQAERCPNCGIPAWEFDEDPDGFEARIVHCIGDAKKSAAWEREKQARSAATRPDAMRGLSVVLERRRPYGSQP